MVGFALALPLIFITTVGVIEIARYIATYLDLRHTLEAGTRHFLTSISGTSPAGDGHPKILIPFAFIYPPDLRKKTEDYAIKLLSVADPKKTVFYFCGDKDKDGIYTDNSLTVTYLQSQAGQYCVNKATTEFEFVAPIPGFPPSITISMKEGMPLDIHE